MNTNETMQQIINAEMKKGTRLVVEVDDVLGKDLVSINVSMNGSAPSLLKMMISAMAINKKLVEDMNTLFGEYESGMTTDNEDALRSFSKTDLEEFE